MIFPLRNIFFATLTINRWVSVFEDYPDTKKIIYESFSYLVEVKRIKIYGFVIMRDHIHLILEIRKEQSIYQILNDFKKHTGRLISKYLQGKDYLGIYLGSERIDRTHKIWKQNSSALQLKHQDILYSKLAYIHNNPTKGNYRTCSLSTQYKDSSAFSYSSKNPQFTFLTLFKDFR